MLKFLRIPFGSSGDKAAIPDATDPAGSVSYQQGFGSQYALPKTNPSARNIPREQTNQLYFDITTAIGELQSQGVPDFITSTLNGGTAYSYAQNALVRYNNEIYVSLVAANTATPADATKWAKADLSKLRRWPMITDYGTITGVPANDTPIFLAAAAAASFIEVPEGIVAKVTAGAISQYYKFWGAGRVYEDGQEWTLPPYPQTGKMGKFYVNRTFGIYETATAFAVTANSNVGQLRTNPPILGTTTQGLAQNYTDRDHVGMTVGAYSFTPDVLDNTTTYTATTLTNTAVASLLAAGKLTPGTIIDTQHATPFTGRVQSVAGNVVTVDGWWPKTPVGAGTGTPANSTGAIVNPNNKIFGVYGLVSATGNGTTTGAAKMAGQEWDLTTASSGSAIPGTIGYDMVSMPGSFMDVGFSARGRFNIKFLSDSAGGIANYGFRSVGDTRGFNVEDATGNAIEVNLSSVNTFAVGPNGATTISVPSALQGPLAMNGGGQTMLYSGSGNQSYTQGMSGLATVLFIAKNTTQNRSINASGTINANGADCAEYERNNGLKIAKGDIVGFKSDGTLTLTFSEALRFGVKSTNPHLVGGDSWGSDEAIGVKRPEIPSFSFPDYDGPTGPGGTMPSNLTDEQLIDWQAREAEAQNAIAAWQASRDVARKLFDEVTMPRFMSELQTYEDALENARQFVDRIAYSGKVPVNVTGATAGDYIVPVATESDTIAAICVSEPTFEQYRKAVGRVNRILEDGRAEIAVITH